MGFFSFQKGWQKILLFLCFFVGFFIVYFSFASEKTETGQRFVPKSDILHLSLKNISEFYFDQQRINPAMMYKKALDGVSNRISSVLVDYQQKDSTTNFNLLLRVGDREKNFATGPLQNLNQLEEKLGEALEFIKSYIPAQDLENVREVDYAAVEGILTTLDPHSAIFAPQIYKDFSTDTQGTYGGVGMVINQKEGKIQVVSLIGKNSPAFKAGIQPKDFILQIDQLSTAGMDVEEAKNRLRGPKNTKITLLVQKPNLEQPVKYEFMRAEIQLDSVESHVFQEKEGRIGYIRLSRETGMSSKEMKEHLNNLSYSLSDFKGLILDLRGNPGGLLNEAIEISNLFLSSGVIVSIAGVGKKNVVDYKARPYDTTKDFPMVVLVNRFSASAAEIISAALQKNKRVLLLGETTFGKGTVQTVVENFSDGSALKLTTAQYLTPGHESIQSVGVVPDVFFHPITVKKDLVQMIPIISRKEKGLENSLDLGDSSVGKKSPYELSYLDNQEDASDNTEDPTGYENINLQVLEKDYLVRSARQILLGSKTANFTALKASMVDYLSKQKKLQSQIFSDETKKLAVQWAIKNGDLEENFPNKTFPNKFFHHLQVQFAFEKKQGETWQPWPHPFPPKTKGRLVVTVKNQSGESISHLFGTMKSDDRLFQNKQFLFGDMKPKQTKTWAVPFSTSVFEVARVSKLDLDLLEYPQAVLGTYTANLEFLPSEQPIISYQYSFQSPTGKAQLQNSNQLLVKIKNDSSVDMGSLTAVLKNADVDSLSLKRGRMFFPKFSGKQEATASFDFDLVGAPKDGEYNLLLTVFSENYPNQAFSQKINFALDQKFPTLANKLPRVEFSKTPLKSEQKEFQLQAQIYDEKGLKDIYVFQNNRKIYFTRLKTTNQKQFTLNLPLVLEKKSNEITVIASDQNDARGQNREDILVQ